MRIPAANDPDGTAAGTNDTSPAQPRIHPVRIRSRGSNSNLTQVRGHDPVSRKTSPSVINASSTYARGCSNPVWAAGRARGGGLCGFGTDCGEQLVELRERLVHRIRGSGSRGVEGFLRRI